MVQQAIDTFGGLDILVNNAGFVRDRMLVNTSEEEWDAVIRVHLKGHFAPLRHAGAWWRSEAKEGRQRAARVINTSSGAGMQGSIGQTTYSAAKAGIAGMTLVAAAELGRYGVNVNAIAPVARTRMTEGAFPEMMAESADAFDAMDPANNSPIVAWLASEDCDVTAACSRSRAGRSASRRAGGTDRSGTSASLGRRRGGAAVRELIGQAVVPTRSTGPEGSEPADEAPLLGPLPSATQAGLLVGRRGAAGRSRRRRGDPRATRMVKKASVAMTTAQMTSQATGDMATPLE